MIFKSKDFADAPSVLDIKNLSLSLSGSMGSVPVLKEVSIQIRQGETVCLVGESGSGKSVTSLAVMGLLPRGLLNVTGGRIELEGNDLIRYSLTSLREARMRDMAMIFQEPMTALNPVVRVGNQVDEVLRIHTSLSSAERKRRVQDMLDQVHIPDVKRVYESYPHQLSGGQRQRIMIAMALILKPKLLIADEPTTALDVTTQRQVLELIAELQELNGTAVMFITHDMGVVAEIADTVYVMKDGQIVEKAPVETLLRSPQQAYTKQLLRSVPSLIPHVSPAAELTAPVIRVEGMRKVYGGSRWFAQGGGIPAVSDVSFSVSKGRTLGIVGESGSGKSTVARCIIRLVDPTAGAVHVAGTNIATLTPRQLRPLRRHLQIVFQDPFRSLNPRRTIGSSLVEGLLNIGVVPSKAHARSAELLKLVGLPADASRRYPHQFSGGQRQRIAIARAIAMEPDVLIADEAVSALDVSVQAQVLDLLRDLQKKLGIAILFITHDLRAAAQICDDVIVMQRGSIVECNSAANVLSAPQHPYTRSLIEAAPARGWDFANFRPAASPRTEGGSSPSA